MSIEVGNVVEHRSELALGQGIVKSLDEIAGVKRAAIRWANRTGLHEHTFDELKRIVPLVDRLRSVGPATRLPFQLKVFARWFEARHALTGELSNQPFQMLPHQVVVTNRVVHSAPDNRAWLIADDVGLGKTIEAGMIMEVLRKKTLGRFRCLVVTPAGLMAQWKEELARRFHREFRIFDSRVTNDLEAVDQLIASVDTLKLKRFKEALDAVTRWDLVIFDEAHHLATVPSVLAYQLAYSLRATGKARNMLLLTATPHSGNNEHFFNMLRILREDLFPKGTKDYSDVPLRQVMIRNRKSDVTDARGNRIFRGIGPATTIEFAPDAQEVAVYEELQRYLRSGYKVADRLQREKDGQKASAVGFLMSTFGKLASSSRAAIESALENRNQALQAESSEVEPSERITDERFPGERAASTVGSAALDVTSVKGKRRKTSPIEGELKQVQALLEALRGLSVPDSKLTSFVSRVKELEPHLKLLIFTEYRATQAVLCQELMKAFGERSVAKIHGGMTMNERREQVDAFNESPAEPRFMISTEAGGEGLNMQKSCHTVVNYDLPWNPMALLQRIGRVYRYGQTQPVVVFNVKVNSRSNAYADHRIYQYLETKIEEVTKKLKEVQDGDVEDLRSEVLGQVATQISFADLYKSAVEGGRAKVEGEIDSKTNQIQTILSDPGGMLGIFKGLDRFDVTEYHKVAARVRTEHLEFFVRQYLGNEGCPVKSTSEELFAFRPPKRLVEISSNLVTTDPYQVRDTLAPTPIERATVDKKRAQTTLGSRLMRFGDPAFEAMVQHVQHGGYAEGVASIELPSEALTLPIGGEGTWVLFDLRVVRQEATGARVLRNELASYVVQRGAEARMVDDVVEHLHGATDGPLRIDLDEARRAYGLAREAAMGRLRELYREVVHDYGTDGAIIPQDVQDVALAWVRAA